MDSVMTDLSYALQQLERARYARTDIKDAIERASDAIQRAIELLQVEERVNG